MKTFACLVNNHKLASQLGLPVGRGQVRVFGRAPSRAAFARALIAAGLDHRPPAAVSRWLAEWGGETGNTVELALAREGGDCLFAASPHGVKQDAIRIPLN